MVKKILFFAGTALILFVLAFFGVAFLIDPHSEISREITINASPDKIEPYIINLKNWEAWCQFKKIDNNLKYTFSKNTIGVGAEMSWFATNRTTKIRITKYIPNQEIQFDLITESDQNYSKGFFIFKKVNENKTLLILKHTKEINLPIARYLKGMMDSYYNEELNKWLSGIKKLSEI